MIDQVQQNAYLLQVQKLMSSDVIANYWSHNMDLLAIVTTDNLLQLYRINFKAQKVFQIEQDKPITTVSFSPDSQHLSYGTNDGQIKVLKSQNGQLLLTCNDPINQQLISFNFVQYSQYPDIHKLFPFNQMIERLILKISPHKNCNKASIVKINYFNELVESDDKGIGKSGLMIGGGGGGYGYPTVPNTIAIFGDNQLNFSPSTTHLKTFTLLLSSSQKHTSLLLNGFMTIAQISYEMLAIKEFKGNNDYKVWFSHYNINSSKIQSILVQNQGEKYVLHHVAFETSLLSTLQSNIIKFNCLLNYVSQIINFVQHAYPAAQLYLRDIIRQYNSKMNLIDDPQNQNINPCQELFKYLNYGITSPALINFLTKEVYDTKVLQKLDQTLNGVFNALHDLLLQSIQNSLQRAYLIIKELKQLCQLEKYTIFGVKNKDLIKIQEQIQKLYTMGEILLVQSTQAKFDIRNLLVWLNKATIKTSNDPNVEIENTKSYLSRYTVDFTRLHAFLETQDRFKLQNLTSFFSKGNQIHSMNIPETQFRLLTKKETPSKQYIQKTKKIEKLLELEDIIIPNPQTIRNAKMSIQLTYKSFKLQLKQLKDQWKILKVKPIIQISKLLQQKYHIEKIGQVEANQMYAFDIKTLIKKNQDQQQHNGKSKTELILYWIQRVNVTNITQCDKVIQYNCSTQTHRSIFIPRSLQAISLSVGIDIMLLTQSTQSMQQQKSIIQIINQQWNGQQLQIGKKIQRLNGEIMLTGGLRGLNSLIINKNKLVVFD